MIQVFCLVLVVGGNGYNIHERVDVEEGETEILSKIAGVTIFALLFYLR